MSKSGLRRIRIYSIRKIISTQSNSDYSFKIFTEFFNSVPYAVVGMIIPQEQMGVYMGALNAFVVVGQQLSNFAIGAGVGAAVGEDKGIIIGCGAIFAILAAIYCYWIMVPDQVENGFDDGNNEPNESNEVKTGSLQPPESA